MKKGRKKLLDKNQAKIFLYKKGIRVKPSYHHEDYLFTSFTMPWDVKEKLDAICLKHGVSRSGLIQVLIREFED